MTRTRSEARRRASHGPQDHGAQVGIAGAASKVRRGQVDFDKDKLAADVQKAWEEYDDNKLARMWEYHRYCLQAALDIRGGNWYPRHRPAEMKAVEAGELAPELEPEPPRKRQRGAVATGLARRLG